MEPEGLTIGRSPSNHIMIGSKGVPQHHSTLLLQDNRFILRLEEGVTAVLAGQSGSSNSREWEMGHTIVVGEYRLLLEPSDLPIATPRQSLLSWKALRARVLQPLEQRVFRRAVTDSRRALSTLAAERQQFVESAAMQILSALPRDVERDRRRRLAQLDAQIRAIPADTTEGRDAAHGVRRHVSDLSSVALGTLSAANRDGGVRAIAKTEVVRPSSRSDRASLSASLEQLRQQRGCLLTEITNAYRNHPAAATAAQKALEAITTKQSMMEREEKRLRRWMTWRWRAARIVLAALAIPGIALLWMLKQLIIWIWQSI